MQKTRPIENPARQALLLTLCLAAVVVTALALGITGKSEALRAAGAMPEVVTTADLPRPSIEEIVVRAPHPGRLNDAADQESGINQ